MNAALQFPRTLTLSRLLAWWIVILAAGLALSGCNLAPFGQTFVSLKTKLCGSDVELEYASGQERKTARVDADCLAQTFTLETTETTGIEAQTEALRTIPETVNAIGDVVREIAPLWTGPLGDVQGAE